MTTRFSLTVMEHKLSEMKVEIDHLRDSQIKRALLNWWFETAYLVKLKKRMELNKFLNLEFLEKELQ